MSFLRSNDISLAEPLLDGSAIMRAAVRAAKLSTQTFLLKLKIDSIGECGHAAVLLRCSAAHGRAVGIYSVTARVSYDSW